MRRTLLLAALLPATLALAADDAPLPPGEDPEVRLRRGDSPLPPTPIPPVTDADRAAAFPELHTHHEHGHALHWYLLADRLEWQDGDEHDAIAWEIGGWVGTDIDRLWLRTEGERADGRTEHADVHLLYGRAVARWWDLVAGVRHDFGGGPDRNWAAFGVQGLAPYLFEVEATVYLGEAGRTAARLEAEYDLLLSNRLILQPLVELDFYGQDDPARGIGSGLSSAGLELRLRYEITRRFAPYIGLSRERLFGGTAEHAREHGEDPDDTRLVAGIRFWF